MAYLVLGIAMLAGILLAGKWYVNADPKSILRALKWLLIVIVIAVAVFFIISGRIIWAIAAIPALLPWFFRIRQAARTAKTYHRMGQSQQYGPGAAGQKSDVETRFLSMTLDHASGDIDGEVREGPHVGQRLHDLTIPELQDFYQLCREDRDSLRLFETWLDRYHPSWRDEADHRSQSSTSSGSGPMDRSEALDILGLDERATEQDIREAHRRLIANLHPDKGGSSYLAAQINRAKDVLLSK